MNDKNLIECKKQIEEADFSNIFNRLTIIERWSKNHAEEAVKQYRRFLFLNKKYGSEFTLPPSEDIDHAWHAHILYTNDYFDFCKKVFGEYLHHRPHQGFSDPITLTNIQNDYEQNTQRLYQLEFGTYIYEVRSPITNLWCRIKQAFYEAKI
jgi:hypothetical protein